MTKIITSNNNTPVVGFVQPVNGCDCGCKCRKRVSDKIKSGPQGSIKIGEDGWTEIDDGE